MHRRRHFHVLFAAVAVGVLGLAALIAGPAAARDTRPQQQLTPSEPPPPPPPEPEPSPVPMVPITPPMAAVKPTEPVPGPPRDAPAKRQVKVKVMSFNINSITGPGGITGIVEYPPPWWLDNRKRDERSAQIIEESKADVVVIDEAFDVGAEHMLDELKRNGYPHQTPLVGLKCPGEGKAGGGWNGTYGHCSNWPTVKNGGTVIISKLPILEDWQYVFREGAGFDKYANKGVALAAFEAPGGGVFWVAGTHLQSSDSSPFDPNGEYEKIRKEQLLEMSDFIAKRANVAKETVLVAGDLNVPVYYDEMYKAGGRLVMDWGQHPALNLFTPLKSSPGGVSVNCRANHAACTAQIFDPYPTDYEDSLDYLGYYAGTDDHPGIRPLDQSPPQVIDKVDRIGHYLMSPSDHFPTWSNFTLGIPEDSPQEGKGPQDG